LREAYQQKQECLPLIKSTYHLHLREKVPRKETNGKMKEGRKWENLQQEEIEKTTTTIMRERAPPLYLTIQAFGKRMKILAAWKVVLEDKLNVICSRKMCRPSRKDHLSEVSGQ